MKRQCTKEIKWKKDKERQRKTYDYATWNGKMGTNRFED